MGHQCSKEAHIDGDDLERRLLSPEEREAAEASPPGRRGVRRLLAIGSAQRCTILSGLLVLVVRLPFSLAIPLLVSETIGAAIDGDLEQGRRYILLIAVAGTVDAILDFWNYYLFGLAQQRIVRDLRIDLFAALLRQDLAFLNAIPVGELSSRLTGDTSEMANDLTWLFRWFTESVVRIAGILAVLFVKDWHLALVTVGVVPICSVLQKVYGDYLQRNARKVQSAAARAGAVSTETLGAAPTVLAFCNEESEKVRYAGAVQQQFRLEVSQLLATALNYMIVNTFLINCCVPAALLLFGIKRVVDDEMSSASLVAFMLYQGQLSQWVTSFMNSFTSLVKSAGAGDKVFELLDRRPQRRYPYEGDPEQPGGAAAPARLADTWPAASPRGEIEFRGVSFSYPHRLDDPVLRGIGFRVAPGEVAAIVGPSGGGKTTLFRLLQGLYDSQEGCVLVDGVDVGLLHPRYLRRRCLSAVEQEPVLFSGTVEENILYSVVDEGETPQQMLERMGDEERADLRRRVERAARVANADEFISQLPDGYATQVGERGASLSGGQKQRVAIARAVIQDPAVLLLDEATSALDANATTAVQQGLEQAMEGRTTLVIAHRLSTIRSAHKIIVVDQGRVVEVGTHEQLLESPATHGGAATYKRLLKRQADG